MKKADPIYVVNKHGHYFEVNCPVRPLMLSECITFATIEDMHNFLTEKHSLCMEEVDGNEFTVDILSLGGNTYSYADSRGVWNNIETNTSIEQWISQFQL